MSFASTLFLILCGLAATADGRRVDIPIGRTIAFITLDNPTPFYRWPLRIKYLNNGNEFFPKTCDEAARELRSMIPQEFLSSVRHAMSSFSKKMDINLANDESVKALKEHVEADLEAKFLGEAGFLDSINAKIQRSWASRIEGRVSALETSCIAKFGDHDSLWFSLIFFAARQ